MIKELQEIRYFCRNSDKEDVYMRIYSDEKELEKLHSIIKEARERIQKLYDNAVKYGATHDTGIFEKLLEILDKEKDNE